MTILKANYLRIYFITWSYTEEWLQPLNIFQLHKVCICVKTSEIVLIKQTISNENTSKQKSAEA